MRSVVIGGQRSPDGFAGGPVVPDGGGHGQQPLGDAGADALLGGAAVAFEVELAVEGVWFPMIPDRNASYARVSVRDHENVAWPGRAGDPWRHSRNWRTSRVTARRQSNGFIGGGPIRNHS